MSWQAGVVQGFEIIDNGSRRNEDHLLGRKQVGAEKNVGRPRLEKILLNVGGVAQASQSELQHLRDGLVCVRVQIPLRSDQRDLKSSHGVAAAALPCAVVEPHANAVCWQINGGRPCACNSRASSISNHGGGDSTCRS